MDRLKQHVERFMDDLISLLKITDPTAWEAGKELFEGSADRDQLAVDYLIGQPVILQNISQRALCAAGFSESSFVQRISNGGVYRLQSRQITYDDRGLPLAVQLVGVPVHHVGRDVPPEGPNLIGRLDEFVSMETGKQIHGSELLDLL